VEILQEAITLADTIPGPPTRPRVFIAGEVGTLYRQLDRLEEAQQAYANQYAIAKQLGMDAAACRATGNLGIVTYQLALRVLEEDGDDLARNGEAKALIELAMQQLEESSQLAGKIRATMPNPWTPYGHSTTTRYREAISWECLAYGRLSLCYAALGSFDGKPRTRKKLFRKAGKLSSKAVRMAGCMFATGSSVLPMCQFFRGHVFLMQGQKQLALEQFNRGRLRQNLYSMHCRDRDWGITAAMALCKEPSREHRNYLREVVDIGADLGVSDPEGYTALDHAVFSGDAATEEIVLEGLRRHLALSEDRLAELRTEARLRKGYREILQDKLRPILYEHGDDADCIKKLRRAYAETLASDPDKSAQFDHLKFMRYTDFKRFGRLPRSSDGLAQAFGPEPRGTCDDDDNPDALIFFSYRWINHDPGCNTPDDATNTQYRRMIDAAELFLQQNILVEAERLGIWMASEQR
jgi:tetratricopeptide (TPR) repeat protein